MPHSYEVVTFNIPVLQMTNWSTEELSYLFPRLYGQRLVAEEESKVHSLAPELTFLTKKWTEVV